MRMLIDAQLSVRKVVRVAAVGSDAVHTLDPPVGNVTRVSGSSISGAEPARAHHPCPAKGGSPMAVCLFPSSYRCDCGHESDFSERVVREMNAMSLRKPAGIRDSEPDSHCIEFAAGRAVAVICPRLGRCEITGTE